MTGPMDGSGDDSAARRFQRVDTILVVPCHNEETRLPVDEFVRFARETRQVGLLFVDDGSTDQTGRVLEDIRREMGERVEILELPKNVGKAEAVRQGVLAALDHAPELVGYWDADLATGLDEVTTMHDLLQADVSRLAVLGSRVRLLGRRIQRSPGRHYAGRIFATLASLKLRLPVYDTQCGAKLFRVTPDTRAAFATPFSSRWIFDVEILARLTRSLGPDAAAARVVEHPLTRWTDVGGSKLRLRDALVAGLQLLALKV